MSMSIQQSKSAPEYIEKFIRNNKSQLDTIYQEGINNFKIGILVLQCSEKNNKMDVQFMNEPMITELLTVESWEQLKLTIEGKQLFLVKDMDKSSIFLLYF